MYQALMANEVQMVFGAATPLLAATKDGRTRLIGVASQRRAAQMPDVPTFRELGMDGIQPAWVSFAAPARTPQAVIDRLHAASLKAMQSAELREVASRYGLDVLETSSPQAATKRLNDEMDRMSSVARATGIRPQ